MICFSNSASFDHSHLRGERFKFVPIDAAETSCIVFIKAVMGIAHRGQRRQFGTRLGIWVCESSLSSLEVYLPFFQCYYEYSKSASTELLEFIEQSKANS